MINLTRADNIQLASDKMHYVSFYDDMPPIFWGSLMKVPNLPLIEKMSPFVGCHHEYCCYLIFNLVKIQIPAPIIKANTIRPRRSGASNLTKKTITKIIIVKAMIPIIAVPIVEAVPITIRLDYSSEY